MGRDRYERSMRHGRITGPLAAVVWTAVFALTVWALHLPRLLPVLVACLGVTWAIVSGRKRGMVRANVVYRVLCWTLPAAWATWVLYAGFSPLSSMFLAGGAVFLGLFGIDFAAPPAAPAAMITARTTGGKWAERIDRVCNVRQSNPFGLGVEVTGTEQWENGAGYTITGRFPDGSTLGWGDLSNVEGRLANMASLKRGCTVRTLPGESRHEWQLRVSTVNQLADEIPYPEFRERSITEDFSLGRFPDGNEVTANMRLPCALVWGTTGGGKTNALDQFTGHGVQCRDALVWHIDMNSGGMSMAWIQPSLDEGLPFAIDWVAADEDEALKMTRVALAELNRRKGIAQRLKSAGKTKLMPVSADLPEILIVVDEIAELLGSDASGPVKLEVGRNLKKIQRLGRDCAIRLVLSGLRVTSGILPVEIRTLCDLRVATRVTEDSELAYGFEWNKALRADELVYEGCGFVRLPFQGIPQQFKLQHLRTERIEDLVRWAAGRQPVIDLGEVYAARWDRLKPWLDALAGDAEVPPLVVSTEAPATAPALGGDAGQFVARFQSAAAKVRETLAGYRPVQKDMSPAELWEMFDAPDAAEPVYGKPEVDMSTADTGAKKAYMVALVGAHTAAGGIETGALFDLLRQSGMTEHLATFHRWKDEAEAAGQIKKVKRGIWVTA